jgi:hypothetical protein
MTQQNSEQPESFHLGSSIGTVKEDSHSVHLGSSALTAESLSEASDAQLLELAAKAVGVIDDATNDSHAHGLHRSEHGQIYVTNASGWRDWDPLTDDGDALRLAVKLRLHVDHHRSGGVDVWVIGGTGAQDFCENTGGDERDTRRAIVRAAAAIAKATGA